MSGRQAFVTVPWQRPFLPALLDLVLERTGGDAGSAFLVFPHARPARYLTDLLRAHAAVRKPCILPRMEPVTVLFSALRGRGEGTVPAPAGLLDQVALLLTCVRGLQAEGHTPLQGLPLGEARRFFPWGVRLAALMEDFVRHNRTPADYGGMEGEVSPFAAALLGSLAAIHGRYMAALREGNWTTPGFDAFCALRHLDKARELVQGKTLFLAGFHTLSGAEDLLFRHLWANCGATVCLHADPAVVNGSPHWSCVELVRWAGRWRSSLDLHEVAPDGALSGPRAPRIRYFAGYDLHSQLAALQEELAANDTESSAVVLPDTSLLLPVLHHLPDADVNISMGYPLARSPLFRLLESVLALQETRREAAKPLYHWKACVELLRHPYLKMLSPAQGEAPAKAEGASLRRLLHRAEQQLRGGQRFVDLAALPQAVAQACAPPDALEDAPDERALALFQALVRATATAWESVSCLADLAAALEGLVRLLLGGGDALWRRFPIDGECLYRLMQSVIPQLTHTALAREPLPPATLFAMLRELLSAERVPFEADPLVGLQVMGMLETRLLSFRRVFIPDLTEDRLPGAPHHDPLLPDSLRSLAGLPDARGRERVSAYHFFRLLAGAEEAVLLWQEGVEPQGLADGKKQRSRFVEELLWREERRLGRLLDQEKKNGASPLRRISCRLPALPLERRGAPVTEAARSRLDALLAGDISPSLLDAYLRCPLRFFHERLGRLTPVQGVMEEEDPVALGILLHDVLHEFYAQRLGRVIRPSPLLERELRSLFLASLAASPLSANLPPDALIMLEEAGPERLARLLRGQGETTVRMLEENLRAPLLADGRRRTLAGTLDRVDEREGALHILDYKTGHIPRHDKRVWDDEPFWQRLQAWNPRTGDGQDEGEELLSEASRRFSSVQLPAYLYLFAHGTGLDPHDAAYVELRDKAQEHPLLGPGLDDPARSAALEERIPALLAFLLRHLEHAERFFPKPGAYCDWCSCQKACIVLGKRE